MTPHTVFSRFARIIFLLILITFLANNGAYATHMRGFDMSYECTGIPNKYKITLKIFKDCSGVNICNGCSSGSPGVCSTSVSVRGASVTGTGLPSQACTGTTYFSQALILDTIIGVNDVSGYCGYQKSICTNCGTRTPGTLSPAIEMYIFAGIIDLSSVPSSCCLVSVGYSTCCRDPYIPTIVNPVSTGMYTEVLINRCITPCNSSPVYQKAPEMIYAAGIDNSIDLSIADPDGDSLAYSSEAPKKDFATQATYASPYGAYVPFAYLGAPVQSPPATLPLGFYFNKQTGLIRFRPMGSFVAPVYYKITQWKKGSGAPVFAGAISRTYDVYSIVTGGNTSVNPYIKFVTDTGITNARPDVVYNKNICAGSASCITVWSPDSTITDTTYLSINQKYDSNYAYLTPLYNAATRTINGPRQDSVKICFQAPATGYLTTPYVVYINSVNKHCNLPEKIMTSISWTVNPSVQASLQKIKLSTFQYKFKFTRTNSILPIDSLTRWEIENTPGGNTFTSYASDSVNLHTFPGSGVYKIRLRLFSSCGEKLYEDTVILSNFSVQLVSFKNISCKGDSTGSFRFQCIGGKTPYQYKLNNNTILSDSLYNLPADSFLITASDSIGIYRTLWVVLTEPANKIKLNILSSQNLSCFGNSTGTIIASVQNANGFVNYTLNNGIPQTSPVFNGLSAGLNTLRLTDSLGCKDIDSVSLSQPALLQTAISSTQNVLCKGDSSGQIIMSSLGGIAPYQYISNNSVWQNNPVFNKLNAGTWQIWVKDSNGCSTSVSITITEPATKINGTLQHTANISCSQPLATVTLIGSGGNGLFRYGYIGGTETNNPVISNLTSGVYQFYVKDSNLCTYIIPDTIKSYNGITIQHTGVDPTCNMSNNGEITIQANGGIRPLSYRIDSNGFVPNPVFSNLKAGTYLLTVKDSANCMQSAYHTLNNPAALASILSTHRASCYALANGKASVVVSGGTQPYQITWLTTPLQTGTSVNNLLPGKVFVFITDKSQCTLLDSINVPYLNVYQEDIICYVTTDTTLNKDRIYWTNTPDKGTSAHAIFAQNNTANPVILTQVAFNANSNYTDIISSPLPENKKYSYKIQSVDSCNNHSAFSPAHKTISLKATQTGNYMRLSWTAYMGNILVNEYVLYRKTTGGYVQINLLSAADTSYTDTVKGPYLHQYLIQANSTTCAGNTAILSNISGVLATGVKSISANNGGVILFPNPAKDILTIKAESETYHFNCIQIMDIQGKICLNKTFDIPENETEIDISHLNNGSYIAQICHENNIPEIISFVVSH